MNARNPATLLPSGQPFWLKKIVQAVLVLSYGGVDVHGMDNVPDDGPLLVASNHRSYLDPVILGAFLPRRVYHMGKQEIFRNPLCARFLTFFGGFPVNRESPRPSTFRTALRLLDMNAAVVIFPEGGIVNSMLETGMKEGVAALAAISRAPVLPVYIGGSDSLVRLGGILYPWLAIWVGEVIRPVAEKDGGKRENRKDLSKRIAQAFSRLEADFLAAQKRKKL